MMQPNKENRNEINLANPIKKRTLKRVIALLCAVTVLLTMNSLKFDADTLERIPDCGLAEHIHDESCIGEDGEYACGLEAHLHTDACFQTRPEPVGETEVNGLSVEDAEDIPVAAEAVEPEAAELSEQPEIDADGDETPVDETPADEAPEKVYRYSLSEPLLLGDVVADLPVQMEEIVEVAAVVDDDEAEVPVGVEALDGDWLVYALDDFEVAELALVTADDILVLTLTDGAKLDENLPTEAPEAIEETEIIEEADETETIEETVEPEIIDKPEEIEIIEESEEIETVEETETIEEPNENEPTEESDEPETVEETETPETIEETDEPEATEETEKTEETEDTEEPVEDADETERSEDVDEPTDEPDEPEPAVASEAVPSIIRVEYDLTAVEHYPLSLRELIAAAVPATETPAEAHVAEAPAEGAVAEAPVEEPAAEEPAEDAIVEAEPVDAAPAEAVASLDGEVTETEITPQIEITPKIEDIPETETTPEAEAAPEADAIAYDAALLSIEITEDDYLIAPIADFEETEIRWADYAVALLNGRAPVAYPAQEFAAATEYVEVSVAAPEGAFPAGTTMAVADVEDEDTLSGIADTAAEGFVEVQRVHAVDIAFFDAEGAEIEPLIPISVVMTVRELAQDEEAVVVHVDDAGEAALVETGADETPQAADEASSVAFTADAFSVYAVVVTRKLETKVLASDGETYKIELTYGPNAGIPDGAVLDVREVTEDGSYRAQVEETLAGNKLITLARFFDIKIMESDAEDAAEVHPLEAVEVKVTLLEDNVSPVGNVPPVDNVPSETEESAEDDAEERADGAQEATAEDAAADGNADAADDEHTVVDGEPTVAAVHFTPDAETPVNLRDASDDREAVTFMAEGFSVWGVVYTVDFYYGNYDEYHISGGGYIALTELVEKLNIAEDARAFVEAVADVRFSTPELLSVSRADADTTVGAVKQALGLVCEYSASLTEEEIAQIDAAEIRGGDWALISLKAFQTEEELTVTMQDGTVYVVRVEDKRNYKFHYNVNDTVAGSVYQASSQWGTEIEIEVDDNGQANKWVRPRSATEATTNSHLHATRGYHFVKWVLNGITDYGMGATDDSIAYSNLYYIQPKVGVNGVVDYAQTFTACFAPDGEFLILYNRDGTHGTVEPGSTSYFEYIYPLDHTTRARQYYSYSGSEATLKAVPQNGYMFAGWYDQNDKLVSNNPTFVPSIATYDMVVTAKFVADPTSNNRTVNFYPLELVNGEYGECHGGRISGTDWRIVQSGGTIRTELGSENVNATADDGHRFLYWLLTRGANSIILNYESTSIDSETKTNPNLYFNPGDKVYAVFEKLTYVTIDYKVGYVGNRNSHNDNVLREAGSDGDYTGSISQTINVSENEVAAGVEAKAVLEYTTANGDRRATFYAWCNSAGKIVSLDRILNKDAKVTEDATYTAMYCDNAERVLFLVNDEGRGDIIASDTNQSAVEKIVKYNMAGGAITLTRNADDANGNVVISLGADNVSYTLVPKSDAYMIDHIEINNKEYTLPAVGGSLTVPKNADNNVQYIKVVFNPYFKFTAKLQAGFEDKADLTSENGYFTDRRDAYTGYVSYDTASDGGKLKYPITPVMTLTENEVAEGWRFAYWVYDNGNNASTDSATGALTTAATVYQNDTTFVGLFAKGYLVRLNHSELHETNGTITKATSENLANPLDATWGTISMDNSGLLKRDAELGIEYVYSADDVTLKAESKEGYTFLGWFDGNELISNKADLPVSEITRDVNLTPVFEPRTTGFYVWFDGSNGVFRGLKENSSLLNNASTMYTRIAGDGRINGAKTIYDNEPFAMLMEISADEITNGKTTITLPSAEEFAQGRKTLQDNDNTKYALQGWYDIIGDRYYAPGAQNVEITKDTVFYADWFREDYEVGVATDVFETTNTKSFITTRVFDYNNLFNIRSLTRNATKSYISQSGNYDFWEEDTGEESLDFLFVYAGATSGTTINPPGRTGRNASNESSVNGNYYTGIVNEGVWSADVRKALFGTPNETDSLKTLGRKYAGLGNYLYKFDPTTGYYYFDSDLHAASYNATADDGEGRFYVYNYTNKTNKSEGGDETDFLPFNYDRKTFNETYGGVNYWFGMQSEINFFLPNEVGPGAQNSSEIINQSTKGKDMVYKFAGDDDVWVLVDGKMFLNLGGIHGKVYGEINFSTGKITIAQGGVALARDSEIVLGTEDKGIITYDRTNTQGSDASVVEIDFEHLLKAGDHTLTLYYLERGSSQSNCAIYFNIAPRYRLKLHKVGNDTSHTSNYDKSLAGATFGFYSNQNCTRPVLLKDTKTKAELSTFTTDQNGYIDVSELVAGRTYYIKEIEAPAGYPDVTAEVITLTLDAYGKPTVSSTADTTGTSSWTMASVTPTNDGTFILNMEVKNRKDVSITAKKIWAMLDGRRDKVDENFEVDVKLHRYSLMQNPSDSTSVIKYDVNLITCYYVDENGNPTNVETDRTLEIDSKSYTVNRGGSIEFDVSVDTEQYPGAGLQSVGSPDATIKETVTDGDFTTENFFISNSWRAALKHGKYEISNIRGNVNVYINFIGKITNVEAFGITQSVPNVNVKAASGNITYAKSEDATFKPTGQVVTLNKDNNWTATWTNLESTADNTQYYYYVTEESNTSSLESNPMLSNVPAYVKTYSSDGLSGGGTITVRNTLQANKIRLRKRDVEKDSNGKNQYLAGAEFLIYLASEYEKEEGSAKASLVVSDNATVWLDKPTYNKEEGTFVSDSEGLFYSGYLPVGTYYIVEKKAPDGYEPLQGAYKIIVDENGLKYQTPDEVKNNSTTWHKRGVGSDSYYCLYIDNEKLQHADITIEKVTKTEKKPLTDAEFTVTRVDENGNVITDEDGYSYSQIKTVGNDGKVTFENLSVGRYKLEETKVPDGYIKQEGPYYFTVEVGGTSSLDETVAHTMITASGNTYTVENEPGVSLPSTGGPGTTLYTVSGLGMMLLALALLLKKRRI